MSDDPRPGSVAAFKQRQAAYQLTREFSEALDDARSMSAIGMHREVADNIGGMLKAIDGNRDAVRMMSARGVEMQEARGLLQSAQRQAQTQVHTVQQGSWHTMDGYVETRLSIGRSASGHHFMLEQGTPSHEASGAWSKAYRTAEIARTVGRAAEDRAHGVSPDQNVQRLTVTPRQQHAKAPEAARSYREAASVTKSQRGGGAIGEALRQSGPRRGR